MSFPEFSSSGPASVAGSKRGGTDNGALERAEEGFNADVAGALQRAILNSANFSSIATDANGIIQLFNVGAERMMGYKAAEVTNKITPADISDPQELIARANALSLELGIPIRPGFEALVFKASRGIEDIYELTYIRKDGSRFPAVVSVTALRDAADVIIGYLLIGTDNTVRKLAEIEQQAKFLQIIIDAMPYPVFYKDRQRRYIGCNRAFEQFYGILREQIAGKTEYEIAPKERADMHSRVDDELFTHTGAQTWEESVQSADGVQHDVIFHKATFEGLDGKLAGLVGAVVDITERKREEVKSHALEEQLRQAQKMEAVGRLAGGIAHDFNNILMVIQSYTEMLQDRLPTDDPLRKNTREIMRAAGRAASLTGQMLAFSRKQIISPIVLDPNAVIGETAKMLKRLIGEDIDFQVDSESFWTVKADPDQIAQILMNLCVNSRDAMPQGGTLTIATGNATVEDGGIEGQPYLPPGDYVRLSVTDTGTGICREVQEQVFDPFFTTKEVGKGTGLGLATVYGIVKQNGGFVWVDSELGEGACFTIYLPRVTGALVPEILKREARPRGTETLLVAEDEEALRGAMCEYLRDLGYSVFAASSGQEALSAVKQQGHIDLLITDVVMPKMSGRELSQTLGNLRLDLKTIYMSGYTDDAILRHGIHEMGTCFLQKPFSLGTLARKVRDTLDRTEQVH
jgi:two-component system cell cycle sensor histidine kinase/response regulator CckA